MGYLKEKIMHGVFFITALISIAAVLLICFYLFSSGIPAISQVGIKELLLGEIWKPQNQLFGILPMILGSLYVTVGAILVGMPIGILTALFLAKFCSKRLHRWLKPAVELLAGIPSVVYGFFGLMVLVPLIRTLCGGTGSSLLAAALILGVMILPTLIGVCEAAIRAVPQSYYEGALALGASHERSVFTVILPAAKSGIFAAVILGVGRAVGETMAVVMVAGNQPRIPESILEGVRTLTANVVMEMGYATDLHRQVLIANGVILFLFILLLNIAFNLWQRRWK